MRFQSGSNEVPMRFQWKGRAKHKKRRCKQKAKTQRKEKIKGIIW
jgi:hypothetical protein